MGSFSKEEKAKIINEKHKTKAGENSKSQTPTKTNLLKIIKMHTYLIMSARSMNSCGNNNDNNLISPQRRQRNGSAL